MNLIRKEYKMVKNDRTSFVLVILVFLSLCSHPASAQTLSFADETGEVVKEGEGFLIRLIDTPGSKFKTVEALFTVDALPEICFQVITDVEHYPQFMPNVIETRRIPEPLPQPLATFKRYEYVAKLAIFRYDYILDLHVTQQENQYQLHWEYVEGDFRDNNGVWTIKPSNTDEQVAIVHFKIFIDPGRFVPSRIANSLIYESVPSMIESIRNRVQDERYQYTTIVDL